MATNKTGFIGDDASGWRPAGQALRVAGTPATNSSINAPGNVYTGTRLAGSRQDPRNVPPPSSGSVSSSGKYGVFPWMSSYQAPSAGTSGGSGGSISPLPSESTSSPSTGGTAASSGTSRSIAPPLPPINTGSSPSSGTPTAPTPSVGSTGVSSPGTSATPPPRDTNSNARQTTTASSSSTSSSGGTTGLLDFDKMFEYQKRINRELDMPTLRETNQEGYKYRKLEGDDQMGRDTSARRDAAALAMQRDVLSSNLERGTMRQQQALQTRTKDQDLARAMSVLMKRKR